jgi:hypothetical protein
MISRMANNAASTIITLAAPDGLLSPLSAVTEEAANTCS